MSDMAIHRDGRVLYLKGYTGPRGHLAYVYDPVAMTDGYVEADDLITAMAGAKVKVTNPQRLVALYRFVDVATDDDDFGAVLDGHTLTITDPAKALDTLDNAIELCRDQAEQGMASYRVELGVTQRLRASVLAAVQPGTV